MELVIGSVNNMIIFFHGVWNLSKKDSINIYDDPCVRFVSTPYGDARLAKLYDGVSYRLRLQRTSIFYAFITIDTYLLHS